MRTLLTLFLALCATGIMAQGIVDREVGDFREIKVYDLIEVNLIKSDENRILIKGKNTQDINFVNKDGVLKLKMPLEKKFQGEDTFIEVYYTDIRVIDANEGARIIGNELFVQDRIELRAQEGSEIEIGLQVQDAKSGRLPAGSSMLPELPQTRLSY